MGLLEPKESACGARILAGTGVGVCHKLAIVTNHSELSKLQAFKLSKDRLRE